MVRIRSFLLIMVTNMMYSANSLKAGKNPTYLARLRDGYDKDVRPLLGDRPINVSLEIEIDSIGIIEEAKMEIPLYFFLRQFWNDPRLSGKVNRTIIFSGGVIGNFWRPDVYCYNARQSNIMVDDKDVNSRLSINPDGGIEYSRGSTVVASCEMDLRKFPMDTQHCKLTFGSYSQSDSDIIFSWKKNHIIIDNTELSQFSMDGITLDKKIKSFARFRYTQISFTIKLTRRSGYYIIQAYCPDVLIVSLSWIILWMDAGAIGDRLSLGITTILTVMFLLGSINAFLPKVSYAKALDWYLIVSFIFVFLTLVESMVVFLIIGKETNEKGGMKRHTTRKLRIPRDRMPMVMKKGQSNEQEPENGEPPEVESDLHDNAGSCKNGEFERKLKTHAKEKSLVKCAKFIDKSSRFLFPFSFLVFNIAYWSYYYSV